MQEIGNKQIKIEIDVHDRHLLMLLNWSIFAALLQANMLETCLKQYALTMPFRKKIRRLQGYLTGFAADQEKASEAR